MGPGSLGTGTRFGYSGLEVAGILDVAEGMQFEVVVALRVSDADARGRHQGVSHHTRTALEITNAHPVAPIPAGEPHPDLWAAQVVEVDVPDLSELPYTSMGRTVADDPKFFAYAAAAGVYAAQCVQ
jgi:hypothetical protein